MLTGNYNICVNKTIARNSPGAFFFACVSARPAATATHTWRVGQREGVGGEEVQNAWAVFTPKTQHNIRPIRLLKLFNKKYSITLQEGGLKKKLL